MNALPSRLSKWISSLSGLFLNTGISFFIYTVFIISRTDGINGDEAGYLFYARLTQIGDAPQAGKPPIFYIFNYFLFHGPSTLLQGLQPLGIYIFYALAMAFSLSFLASSLSPFFKLGRPWLVSLVLCLSPMAFYHGTHVMMETPLIICINLLFALSLKVNAERPLPELRTGIAMALLAAFSISEKETILPALCIVLVPCWLSSRKRTIAIPAGILAGVVLRTALRHWAKSPNHGYANSLSNLDAIFRQIHLLPEFITVALFFLGPLTLCFAAWNVIKAPSTQRTWNRALVAIVIFSLLGTLAIALASAFPFSRYTFPSVWIGAIALLALAFQGPSWQKWAVLASLVAIQLNYVWPEPGKMSLWPNFFTHEMYGSGGNTFVGVPIFKWTLTHPEFTRSPCVYNDFSNGEMNYYSYRFLQGWVENGRYFDEHHEKEYLACSGAKLRVERRYGPPVHHCTAVCPAEALRACAPHTIVYFSEKGHNPGNPGLLASGACLYATKLPEEIHP